MKPRLTIAVRRGLQRIAMLAESDVEADLAAPCPQFKGQTLRDINKAFAWIRSLEQHTTAQPGGGA